MALRPVRSRSFVSALGAAFGLGLMLGTPTVARADESSEGVVLATNLVTETPSPTAEVPSPESPPEPAAVAAARPRRATSTPRRRHERQREQAPRGPDAPQRLQVHGTPGAWFYRPSRSGRQRVIVYLHGRGSDPAEHCRKLHAAVQAYGWLLCPIGPGHYRHGRQWNNNRDAAARVAIASLDALTARFGRRVQRHDNVMMGFSEGAFVGMQVALMNPRTFPRWFIVAADDRYIEGERERIERAANSVRRVYLLTGGSDVTLPHSRRAHEILERAFGRRREKLRIIPGMPHELPEDRRLLRNILAWLTR